MNTKKLGGRGEEAAASYLISKKYAILARQYRCRAGEIDLVARDGDTIVFAEVKTRRSLRFGLPSEAVDRRKRQRMMRSAAWYMTSMALPADTPCRFDVIEVYAEPERWRIRHYESAFDEA